MSKPGSGGVASAQDTAIARRERLRALAVESADINNDPYFMKNHLGSYECKLCFTLHTNEGSYLAHTQGKKHQQNLARRAARLADESNTGINTLNLQQRQQKLQEMQRQREAVQKKIGRPGYRVIKQRDPNTGQLSLLFSLHYPSITAGYQPRHRFMSTYEQKVESKNKQVQYLLFAAEPYQVIAFKIPNLEIDRGEGKVISHWEGGETNTFVLQISFVDKEKKETQNSEAEKAGVNVEDEATDWDDYS